MGKFKYTKTDFIPKDTKLTYDGKPNQTIKAGLIGVNNMHYRTQIKNQKISDIMKDIIDNGNCN